MDSFSFTIPQNIKFGAGTLDLLRIWQKNWAKAKDILFPVLI